MSFIAQVKTPDLIKAALDLLISFVTERKENSTADSCDCNASLLLSRCAASDGNWKGGDLIVNLLNVKIPVDVQVRVSRRMSRFLISDSKTLALELLHLLLRKTGNLTMFTSPTLTLVASLTRVIDTTSSEPLRKAAVESFHAYLSAIKDSDVLEATITDILPAFPCLSNLLIQIDSAENKSLVVTTLGIFELCSHSQVGRQQLGDTEVSGMLITLLNRLQALTESDHFHPEEYTLPICKVFSRLCLDQDIEQGSAERLMELLTSFLARALKKLHSTQDPANENSGSTKAHEYTICSAIEIIRCLGRTIERKPICLPVLKRLKPLPLLLKCFETRVPALCQGAEKMMYFCSQIGPDSDFIFLEENSMEDQSNVADIVLEFFDLVKLIDSNAVDELLTRWDIAFRLVRWLAIVVTSRANAQALGQRACQRFLAVFQHIAAYFIRGDHAGHLPMELPQLSLFSSYLMRCLRSIHSVSESAFDASSDSTRPCISKLLDMISSQAHEVYFTEKSTWSAFDLKWDTDTEHIESNYEDRDDSDDVIPLIECVRALSGWLEAFLLWNNVDGQCKDLEVIPLPDLRQRLLATDLSPVNHASESTGIKAQAAAVALVGHGLKLINLLCVLVEDVQTRCYSVAIVELLHLIRGIVLIPGAITVVLTHAKDGISYVSEPILSNDQTHSRPHTSEESTNTPHFIILKPFLRFLESEKTSLSEIQPVVEILSVLCGVYATEQGVDSFNQDQFIQVCLNCGGLLKLLSIINISDTANAQPLQSFKSSVSALCLRFIALVQRQSSLASSIAMKDSSEESQFNAAATPDIWVELLNRSGDIPRLGYHCYPPILMAADSMNFEILAKLVEAGVDVDTSNLDGLTSLMLCFLADKDQALDILRMADVDSVKTDETELTVWMCALVGSPKGEMALLDRCLSRGMNVNISTREGQSLLHSILSCANVTQNMQGTLSSFKYDSRADKIDLQMIKRIVEEHRANVNACNTIGQTPLHLAFLYGHMDVVLYFLGITSDLDTMEPMVPGPIRSLRLQGVNPNIQDVYGSTALHYASFGLWANDPNLVSTMLEAMLTQAVRHPIVPGRHSDSLKNATRQERNRIEIDTILDVGYTSLVCPQEISVKPAELKDIITNKTHFELRPFQLACYGGGTCTSDFGALMDAHMRQQIQANGAIRAAILTFYRDVLEGLCYSIDFDAAMKLAISSQVGESNADIIACLKQWI
ncbi:unnamed protein product [Albugo candida]|nr:unnamed protein product [Albugo candida]|eukprot:CCI48033.1 unnamed protein product [Albugo candida]